MKIPPIMRPIGRHEPNRGRQHDGFPARPACRLLDKGMLSCLRSELKTMWLPSGDQTGQVLPSPSNVKRLGPPRAECPSATSLRNRAWSAAVAQAVWAGSEQQRVRVRCRQRADECATTIHHELMTTRATAAVRKHARSEHRKPATAEARIARATEAVGTGLLAGAPRTASNGTATRTRAQRMVTDREGRAPAPCQPPKVAGCQANRVRRYSAFARKNMKRRPSGKNCGNRWLPTPSSLALHRVTGVNVPPDAGTRISPLSNVRAGQTE